MALVAAAAGVLLLVAGAATAGRGQDLSKALAFVQKQCPGGQRTISSRMWQSGWRFNALYGNCLADDGTDQHVWFFDRDRFIGKDAPTPSHEILGLWRNDRTIAVLYVLYRQSDANCCATGGGAVVRFRLLGKRLHRLDPLPRRAHAAGVRVGR